MPFFDEYDAETLNAEMEEVKVAEILLESVNSLDGLQAKKEFWTISVKIFRITKEEKVWTKWN